MLICNVILISAYGKAIIYTYIYIYTATAAKSLQSCPTLCDPIPGILQARTLEWVAIAFSSTWKWKVKVKSLSCVRLLATPWTTAYQAPPSMGFSRQEYWSGVPLPFLIYIYIHHLLYSFPFWFITEYWTYISLYYAVGSCLFILFIIYLFLKQTCIKVFCRAPKVAQWAKILPAMQVTWVRSLGRDDPLKKWMATHYSILAWRIPWTEEPGGLESHRVTKDRHNWREWAHVSILLSVFVTQEITTIRNIRKMPRSISVEIFCWSNRNTEVLVFSAYGIYPICF